MTISLKYGFKQIVKIFDPIESGHNYEFYMEDATFAKILLTSPFLNVNHAFDSDKKIIFVIMIIINQ